MTMDDTILRDAEGKPRIMFLERRGTPLGVSILTHDGWHVYNIEFEDRRERREALLRKYIPEAVWRETNERSPFGEALERYFEGDLKAIDEIPVADFGTPFQKRVWKALREIPAGETRSYGAFAASLGHPDAARAVGRANGLNPVSIVVPCHRLIGADGSLVHYGGGLERKRWLLAHERSRARNAGSAGSEPSVTPGKGKATRKRGKALAHPDEAGGIGVEQVGKIGRVIAPEQLQAVKVMKVRVGGAPPLDDG